ncbi:MAG: GTPase-associated system all-helical protein GASH [Verrucomicrobiae bacterium]|nr:GTPase-associated system all-helical protein GASH [Verrucomicrobiae bacterium]
MHSHFSEWFLSAGIELQDDVLQKRWVGVEAFVVEKDGIVPLVEMFFGSFDGKDTFLQTFRDPFKKADGAFRMKDNNQELSVLAGATLMAVIEDGEVAIGDLAALAIMSCSAQNLRAAPIVGDIAERAAKHLNVRTLSRTQPDPNAEENDDATMALVEQLQRDLAAVTEESNVLWWVFGECSRDTGKRWSDCLVEQAAIMAGKELADLTRTAPGPAASGALLDKVVKLAKPKPPAQVILKNAIAGLPAHWRESFVKTIPQTLLHICPVSNAIKLSLDLAAGDAWIQALPGTTKIQRGGKIAPQLLAYQVFLERLFTLFWEKVE